ncbi:MAG: chloride channel protein, partial [Actinomycetota bacterium]
IAHLATRAPGSRMVKPAVAGVLVGLIGLAIPAVLGTGYGWVQQAMSSQLLGIPLWIVLALPFAKILATSLSIGSGGSGGIFGPGMMIGAFLGASIWRLLAPIAPGVPLSPAPFVVVGMMASFGAIAHAPIAVMLMVAEMTGSLELLAPAMLAVGVAVLVVGDHTIYTSQLKDRTESSANKLHAGMPLLSSVPVTDAMRPPRMLLEAEDSVADSLRALIAANRSVAAVVERSGIYQGVVTVDKLSDADEEAAVGGFADRAWPAVFIGASMEAAAEAIVESGGMWVPALDDQRRVVGVLDLDDVFGAYRTALESNYRHFARVTTGATLIDAELDESSTNVGRSIANAEFPPTTLILSIRRNDQLIFPQAGTILEVGDRASILTDPADIGTVESAFRGGREAANPPEETPPLI